MGNLPADRFESVRPFHICGVDLFGPINVSLRIRGRPPIKKYFAVFVCFASKSVHLAFKSFIARRGVPHRVHSDNATNFLGARNELRSLQSAFEDQQSQFQLFVVEKGIEMKPHFGGLWEAAVKSAKEILVRQVADASLTEAEVRVYLADTEAVLNSPPLTPTSTDPNEGEALTPGHLLIGQALHSLPQGLEPVAPLEV